MAGSVDASLPPFISISSTMPIESQGPTTTSEPETNPINSLGSKSHSLLRLPSELALYLSNTNDTLMRLNKLLTTTAGLEYFLSTLNYSCYLLTFLHARSPPRLKLAQFLSRVLRVLGLLRPPPPSTKQQRQRPDHHPPPPSNLANLTALLTNTRTTLRLTALLPLYTWLRTLLSPASQKQTDPYLQAIALTQCLAYIFYQALENVAHLVDLRILPASLTTAPWNPLRQSTAGAGASTAKLWLISSRFWLLGVSCDVVRLLREAYVEAQGRRRRRRQPRAPTTLAETERVEHAPTEAEAEAMDTRWWSELFVAGCWLPVCVHYSLKGGLFKPSVEDGWVGVLGLAASWEGWRGAWAETKG